MTAQRPLSTPRARERREQLLAVSAAFWADRDYDDVSIDEIAAEAGVSHGLVFQHFGSKKNLYLAHLEQLIGEFRRRTTAAPSAEPAEALTTAIRAYYDWAHQYPEGYRSLIIGGGSFREARERLEAARWHGVTRLADGAGFDPADPDVAIAMRAWIGYLDSAVLASLDVTEPDRSAVIALATQAFIATATELHRRRESG